MLSKSIIYSLNRNKMVHTLGNPNKECSILNHTLKLSANQIVVKINKANPSLLLVIQNCHFRHKCEGKIYKEF